MAVTNFPAKLLNAKQAHDPPCSVAAVYERQAPTLDLLFKPRITEKPQPAKLPPTPKL